MTDIHQSQLPPDLLHPPTRPPQHLITLSSVEDDALGEELQVTWEVEPGAEVSEEAALQVPAALLRPSTLTPSWMRCAGDRAPAHRIRALQAPFRSTSEDDQLDLVMLLLAPEHLAG